MDEYQNLFGIKLGKPLDKEKLSSLNCTPNSADKATFEIKCNPTETNTRITIYLSKNKSVVSAEFFIFDQPDQEQKQLVDRFTKGLGDADVVNTRQEGIASKPHIYRLWGIDEGNSWDWYSTKYLHAAPLELITSSTGTYIRYYEPDLFYKAKHDAEFSDRLWEKFSNIFNAAFLFLPTLICFAVAKTTWKQQADANPIYLQQYITMLLKGLGILAAVSILGGAGGESCVTPGPHGCQEYGDYREPQSVEAIVDLMIRGGVGLVIGHYFAVKNHLDLSRWK